MPVSSLRFSSVLAFAVLLAGTSTASAQTRVAIRPTPKPGQVIQVVAEQQILLRTGEKAEEPGPAYMLNKNVLAYTQINGTFDKEGRLEAQVTVDRLELDESFGGRQRQVPDTTSLKGRILAVTFDRTGKLLGIKVPPDIDNNMSRRLTQLLAGAYGMLNFLPAVELTVGEETKTTTELPMRLPGSVAKGPVEAAVNLTLRSVEKKGNDRIAHMQQRIDVATATTDVKISGGGTIDVNLDGGFVSATDTEWIFSGVIPATTGGAQPPPFYGSIKINVTAN